jgi:hypothetical protein
MAAILDKAVSQFAQSWQFTKRESRARHYLFDRNRPTQGSESSTKGSNLPQQSSAHQTSWEPIPKGPTAHDKALELIISYGWGNAASVLQISQTDFVDLCTRWELSPGILSALVPFSTHVPQVFEYHFDGDSDGSASKPAGSARKTTLHLAFKLDIRRHSYITCICRYDIQKSQLKAILFESGVLGPENQGVSKPDTHEEILEEYREILAADPLCLIDIIFDQVQRRMRLDISTLNRQLFATEALIGVTTRTTWLRRRGYTVGSTNYDDINAKLYHNLEDVSRISSRCSTIRLFAEKFQAIANEIKGPSYHVRLDPCEPGGRRRIEADSLLRRLELDTFEVDHARRRLESQFSILFNLVNQRDSRLNYQIAAATRQDSAAMRTISILTLIFLPSTFVSTVFSTTVFDFQNWSSSSAKATSSQGGAEGPPVASRGWWVYLLCCVVLTLGVVCAWYLWIDRKLERTLENDAELGTGTRKYSCDTDFTETENIASSEMTTADGPECDRTFGGIEHHIP